MLAVETMESSGVTEDTAQFAIRMMEKAKIIQRSAHSRTQLWMLLLFGIFILAYFRFASE